jgi:hypothetical protein
MADRNFSWRSQTLWSYVWSETLAISPCSSGNHRAETHKMAGLSIYELAFLCREYMAHGWHSRKRRLGAPVASAMVLMDLGEPSDTKRGVVGRSSRRLDIEKSRLALAAVMGREVLPKKKKTRSGLNMYRQGVQRWHHGT